MQEAAVAVVIHLPGRVQSAQELERALPALQRSDLALEHRAWNEIALEAADVQHFRTVQAKRATRHACGELERQHAHADEVRAMNALEGLGQDRANAEEARALRGPVARRSSPVLGACDDHQRYPGLPVLLRGVEDAHRLAARFVARGAALDRGGHLVAHTNVE